MNGSPLDAQSAREVVRHKATGARAKYRKGSFGWAVIYNLTLFVSVILSALAALVLTVPSEPMTNLAAAFAGLAALLTTASGVGGFEGKWHADRDAFHRLDELLLDLDIIDMSAQRAADRYKRIISSQRRAWIQGGNEEPDAGRAAEDS